MDGYNDVFVRAVNSSQQTKIDDRVFETFRSQSDLYQFIHNGDSPPDPEAVRIAQSIDPVLYDAYVERNKNRKKIGYADPSSVQNDYDECDSRHVMMSMVLFKNLPEPISNIVEIGGEFANWLYINNEIQNFDRWTIVDLPHLGLLQAWALGQVGVPESRYELVSAFDYDAWAETATPDLVIGTHSLSEFSWDVFVNYFDKVITKSKYLFYSYHKFAHPQLAYMKLSYITSKFDLVKDVPSQGGDVSNSLYVRK